MRCFTARSPLLKHPRDRPLSEPRALSDGGCQCGRDVHARPHDGAQPRCSSPEVPEAPSPTLTYEEAIRLRSIPTQKSLSGFRRWSSSSGRGSELAPRSRGFLRKSLSRAMPGRATESCATRSWSFCRRTRPPASVRRKARRGSPMGTSTSTWPHPTNWIRCVHGAMQLKRGQVLPRSAVSTETWAKLGTRFGTRFAKTPTK